MDLLKSIFRGDRVIQTIFLPLCLISVTEVSNAASTLTYKSGDHQGPITQHSIILMVGTVVVVLIYNIPYKWSQVFPVLLLPASAILLVLVTMMERINGAAHWMTFMDIQFQPSEIAKMAVIVVTAFVLSKEQDEDGAHPKASERIMIVTGATCLLITPENLPTAALLFGMVFLMMFIERVSTKKLLVLIGGLTSVGIIAVTFLLMTKNSDMPFLHRFDTQRIRIEKFTNDGGIPAAKSDINKDTQIVHARITVATSNVVGKGPGNSVQCDFLNQAFSDFIFTVIIGELGLAGGATVVFFHICLLIRVGRITKKCDRTFPVFLVIGIALLLTSQAIFSVMVTVGLTPVTGQPLPLTSKGGASTLINCAYIGMTPSISRYTAELEEQSEYDVLPTMQIETDNGDESTYNEVQSAAEPATKMPNSDTEPE